MDSFNQYKRLIRTGVVGLEILIETLFFGYIWTEIYNVRKVVPFENKGHWLMIGFYVLYLVVFVYLYGGTKYAYHRKGQLILSQTLGTLIANAVMYVQIIMVFGVFPVPHRLAHAAGVRVGLPGDCNPESDFGPDVPAAVSAQKTAADLRL